MDSAIKKIQAKYQAAVIKYAKRPKLTLVKVKAELAKISRKHG